MEIVTSLGLCCAAYRNWFSDRRPNHLFGTARPALIEAGIRNKNRQIVPAAIASSKRTRWAPGHIVATHNSGFRHVIEDAESSVLSAKRILADGFGFRSHLCDTRWKILSCGESIQFLFSQFSQPGQKLNLSL